MLPISNNSAKTKTPGAEVASWINLAAAAPLADLAIRMNGSSLRALDDARSDILLVASEVRVVCWDADWRVRGRRRCDEREDHR